MPASSLDASSASRGRPFTVTDVHLQLRKGLAPHQLCDIYGVEANLLELIANQPAERIEVWERDAEERIDDWRTIHIQSKLEIYAATVEGGERADGC